MDKTLGHNKQASNQHDGNITEPYHKPYRWLMLALLWFLYFSFGVVARSAAPLVTPMIRDLHMSYGQMGLVLGSWQLTYIAFAITAGVIMDRWGVRKSIFAGALVIGLSSGLRFFSMGFITLLFFVALFGIGGPMISIGAPKTISLWFRGKERGTAVGIYTTGPWIGGMIALAATNGVVLPLTGHSWRLAFVCYGAMTCGFAGLWLLLARDADPEGSLERFSTINVLIRLLKVRNVWIILLSGLLAFAIMHGYTSWLPKILENAGMSPAMAGVASAAPFLASIPAVLIIPRLTPPPLRGRIIALLALLAGLAIMWVVAADLPLTIGLLLFGATGSCLFPLLVLVLMETPEVGSKYLGSAAGVFFCVAEIGGFFGPFIVGFLVDLTGNFFSGASFLACLGVAVFGLTFFLKVRPATEKK
jgi:cyanate permease